MPHIVAVAKSSRSRSRSRSLSRSQEESKKEIYNHEESIRGRGCKRRSSSLLSSSTTATETPTLSHSNKSTRAVACSPPSQPDPQRQPQRRSSRTTLTIHTLNMASSSAPSGTKGSQAPRPPHTEHRRWNIPTGTTSKTLTVEQAAPITTITSFGTGCLICRKDDHQDKILVCDGGCGGGEYHMYCLQPPLSDVPVGDWYCDTCAVDSSDDGMVQQVTSLPPAITSRFGEVVFAQGGTGYGWWPSLIFDPRLTVEPARSQARKHLGTRQLVYFFQCDDFPFSVLPDKQIKPWLEGLVDDLHLGRTAKAHGKQRYRAFLQALQVACLEMEKPAEDRLDWEHVDPHATATTGTATSAAASLPLPLSISSPTPSSLLLSSSSPLKKQSRPRTIEPHRRIAKGRPSRVGKVKKVLAAKRVIHHQATGEWFRHEFGTRRGGSAFKGWHITPKL